MAAQIITAEKPTSQDRRETALAVRQFKDGDLDSPVQSVEAYVRFHGDKPDERVAVIVDGRGEAIIAMSADVAVPVLEHLLAKLREPA
ncbi:MAG: hypothetical protein HY859_06745 [Caulobacterales bacterium]|nr:hypothetical protein [Caulobacterales bacterium]